MISQCFWPLEFPWRTRRRRGQDVRGLSSYIPFSLLLLSKTLSLVVVIVVISQNKLLPKLVLPIKKFSHICIVTSTAGVYATFKLSSTPFLPDYLHFHLSLDNIFLCSVHASRCIPTTATSSHTPIDASAVFCPTCQGKTSRPSGESTEHSRRRRSARRGVIANPTRFFHTRWNGELI